MVALFTTKAAAIIFFMKKILMQPM